MCAVFYWKSLYLPFLANGLLSNPGCISLIEIQTSFSVTHVQAFTRIMKSYDHIPVKLAALLVQLKPAIPIRQKLATKRISHPKIKMKRENTVLILFWRLFVKGVGCILVTCIHSTRSRVLVASTFDFNLDISNFSLSATIAQHGASCR